MGQDELNLIFSDETVLAICLVERLGRFLFFVW